MIEKTIRVFCDRCPAISEEFDASQNSLALVKVKLQQRGWKFRTGGRTTRKGDECPLCSGEEAHHG